VLKFAADVAIEEHRPDIICYLKLFFPNGCFLQIQVLFMKLAQLKITSNG
jgi:hypothetical protein